MVFMLVLLATIFLSYKNQQTITLTVWFDRILFGATGLLGLLIAFLWLGTDHQVTIWNLNILWAHPLHLIALFFLQKEKYPGILKYYFLANFILLLILIVSWPLLPQALPWVIMPLILALTLRSAIIAKVLKPDLVRRSIARTF